MSAWSARFNVLRTTVFRTKNQRIREFHDAHYLRHNMRRLEHLASLGLPLAGRTVLELGAGIGDHTSFFLDRDCRVCTSDGRLELLEILRGRYPSLRIEHIDLDEDCPLVDVFEIVYAYGVLYHLKDPVRGLDTMARLCSSLLLLETCVSPGNDLSVNLVSENAHFASQAVGGVGCRPTRPWVFAALKERFPFVYSTCSQPWHPEFPLDWTKEMAGEGLTRAVFVASRQPLDLPELTPTLPDIQVRH